ncbi:YveK family protein [Paraclostridium sordellii]|uniref:YveK family protein n=1 Tax=Paraclostridium sordellii TaxID=1505 RepID=UPI0005E8DF7E|nr:Wzz/FepE/Etk N-terminal domain-containing protein [Paeniclostridium sordellii]CEP49079.1 Cps19aC [[Clostridium] sordellii] [Paeniclostridium sordellii]
MEETVDLREYFHIIKKRAWIIALITVLAMLTSGIISFFILSPVYEANTTLIVNTEQNKSTNNMITGDQLAVTQKLTLTYGEIIESRAVLDSVIEKLNLNMKYEDLEKNIIVSPVKDTQIMSITVKDTNPNVARDIANSIPKVFTKEVKRITKANSVEVIDKAIKPLKPVKPNKVVNLVVAAALGLAIGIFLVIILEYMDNKIKTPQDIEKYIGLPILGVVPNESIAKKGGR